MHGFVYLASPFTHPNGSVRASRHLEACLAAAKLMQRGVAVFAPIPHSYAVETMGFDAPEGFDFWMAQDLPILRHASKLIVLKLDGWDKSRGVQREMEFAKEHGIPVEFMEP